MVSEFFLVGGASIVALLAVSAFFSGSEIALFSLERHRVETMRETGDPRVETLARLREDPHRLLVTILVGNNIVNVAMATIAGALFTEALGAGAGVAVATVVMSVLVLLFGEITPKSYGVANAESLSLAVAGPLTAIGTAISPLVVFFDGVSGAINRVTGGERDIETPYVTREEIEALLKTGEAVGAIDESERDMVQGVFDLGSTRAREVMVPRVNVVAVDVTTPLDEVLDVCASERLTRLPVYEGSVDQVVGIADVRDVERAVREGLGLRDVLLPTIQVPDTREIDELLADMRAERATMVIVRDEFGELEGIITIEDILEEIVGEIFEVGEERLVRRTDDGLLVRGEVTVGEVNDAMEVDLPREGEYETVAGLINAELGRIGDIDDRIVVDDVALTVERVDGNRIRRVRVTRLDGAGEGEGEGEEMDGESGPDGGGPSGEDGTDGVVGDSTADDAPTGSGDGSRSGTSGEP
jgi:CBS domain containing-hemolysin-like protein